MFDTKVFIDCPQCGHHAELISLPALRYRCASCHAVWLWTPRGFVVDKPSEYIEYSPSYWLDTDDTNRPPMLWGGDDQEVIE